MGLAEELPVYKKSYDLSIYKLPFNLRKVKRSSLITPLHSFFPLTIPPFSFSIEFSGPNSTHPKIHLWQDLWQGCIKI